jgi:hypothetical protein
VARARCNGCLVGDQKRSQACSAGEDGGSYAFLTTSVSSRVGGRRGAASCFDLPVCNKWYLGAALFRPPPSEPDMPVCVASGSPTPVSSVRCLSKDLRITRPGHLCQSNTVICRPWPCTRFSLAPTTMAAPSP